LDSVTPSVLSNDESVVKATFNRSMEADPRCPTNFSLSLSIK